MFRIENLCAAYDKKNIFQNVTLELEKNSITALCGLNGSGKSTLLSLMAGIVSSDLKYSGKIFLDENEILKQSPKVNAKKISYLIQDEHPAWNITVEKFVEEGRFVHKKWFQESDKSDKEIIDNSLEVLNISNLKNRQIATLSGGEFQKVRIARCLAQQTEYIFLDEPLSSVDIAYQKNFMELLQRLCENGKTICTSIHDLNIASQFADKIVLMKKNREGIIEGKSETIMANENLEQAYGKKFEIFLHPVTGKKQVW